MVGFYQRILQVAVLILCVTRAAGYQRNNEGLSMVPNDIPAEEDTIDLSVNSFTLLPSQAFVNGYLNLTEIIMKHNQIAYIAPDAFDPASPIQILDFSFNKLTSLPDFRIVKNSLQFLYLNDNSLLKNNGTDALYFRQGLTSLKQFYIERTSIQSIRAFKVSTLQVLKARGSNVSEILPLTSCNKLVTLDLGSNPYITQELNTRNDTLVGLTLFTSLVLRDVGLTYFPGDWLQPVKPSIVFLYLAMNQISHINMSQLEGFSSLEHLDLNSNELTAVPDVWPLFATLRKLFLSRNKIVYMPENVFEGFWQMEYFRIDQNRGLGYFPYLGNGSSTMKILECFSIHLSTGIAREVLATFTNLKSISPAGTINHFTDLSNFTVLNQTLETFIGDFGRIGSIPRSFITSMGAMTSLQLQRAHVECLEEPPANRSLRIKLTETSIYCGCCWLWLKDPDFMSRLGSTVVEGVPGAPGESPCHLGPAHLQTIMDWNLVTRENLTHDCPVTTTDAFSSTGDSVLTETTTGNQSTDHTIKVQSTERITSHGREVTDYTIGSSHLGSKSSEYQTTSLPFTSLAALPTILGKDATYSGFINWNEWLPWTQCHVTCGGGQQMRARFCFDSIVLCNKTFETLEGKALGYDLEVHPCGVLPCPYDGSWLPWQPWTSCSSSSCGVGVMSRYRGCQGPMYGGRECTGSRIERQICSLQECTKEIKEPQRSSSTAAGFSSPELTESDRRTSASVLGSSVVILLVLMVLGVVLIDVPRMVKCVIRKRK